MIKNGREGKTVKITGIAAEYNPFHLGHAYQLKHLRESGRDGIVAVLTQYSAGTGSWDDLVNAYVNGWAVQYQNQ